MKCEVKIENDYIWTKHVAITLMSVVCGLVQNTASLPDIHDSIKFTYDLISHELVDGVVGVRRE